MQRIPLARVVAGSTKVWRAEGRQDSGERWILYLFRRPSLSPIGSPEYCWQNSPVNHFRGNFSSVDVRSERNAYLDHDDEFTAKVQYSLSDFEYVADRVRDCRQFKLQY